MNAQKYTAVTRFWPVVFLSMAMCQTSSDTQVYPTTGSIEVLDESLRLLVPANAPLEIIAEGYEWSEGPVWVAEGEYLLFSDIPPNRIYKWQEGVGQRFFSNPLAIPAQCHVAARSAQMDSRWTVRADW